MPKDELGINTENTYDKDHDEFIETLVINGHMVNVFQNDYGQCYWFQWLEDGELKSSSCGTYNTNYKEEIEYWFKPEIDKLKEQIRDLRYCLHDAQREIGKLKDSLQKDNKDI